MNLFILIILDVKLKFRWHKMDFSAIFEYLKYADKDLGVQNPDNERKDNDGGGSDQEKIASITTDIECLQHKMQNEDERRKQLMECLDYFKNKYVYEVH